jgi:uncharacterized protein YbaA (DUF1428 family)
MHKTLSAFLAIAVVALATALFSQMGKVRDLRRQLAVQQAQAAKDLHTKQAEYVQLQERSEVFKRESEQLREKLADRTTPAPATTEPGSAKKDSGDFMKGMAKMFTDPEMKKVMRSQQAMVVKMSYGDLTKELGLSPDEANLIFDLLAERQMSMASKAMGAAAGDGDPDAAGAEAKTSKEAFDAELKNILGDERMKKFEAFEKTVGERMILQQYQQSMAASGTPLDETQRKNLLGIMTEERIKQPAGPFDPGNKDVSAAMKAMRTGEGMDDAMKQQREFNQRVLARARTVLSADQTNTFEAAQKQMLDMQEMGIKMWKSGMMGGEKPAPPAPPAPSTVPTK